MIYFSFVFFSEARRVNYCHDIIINRNIDEPKSIVTVGLGNKLYIIISEQTLLFQLVETIKYWLEKITTFYSTTEIFN